MGPGLLVSYSITITVLITVALGCPFLYIVKMGSVVLKMGTKKKNWVPIKKPHAINPGESLVEICE